MYGVEKSKQYYINNILLYNTYNSFCIDDNVIYQTFYRTTSIIIGGYDIEKLRAKAKFLYCSS